jgi:CheY-like chemotaxis protein
MNTHFLISEDRPVRILFVEDNELNIFYISKVVKGLKDTIVLAENGQEAVDKASSELYDVIFMDFQLPVLSGYKAIKKIRNLPAPYCNVVIIGMTSNEVDLDLTTDKNTGVSDFIDKTFTRDELKSKISNWLTEKKSALITSSPTLDHNENSPLNKIQNIKARNTMIQIFLKQKEEFLEKMDKSIAECNWENIYFLVHRMQSSVEVMGISLAIRSLQLMEKNYKEKNLEDLKQNYSQIKQSLKNYAPPASSLN